MRRLPPLAAVRVFEAAARLLNFTRAADELGMTQAAVSYQVKLLDERLGATLFAREGRGVSLTPLGARIAPAVTGAFDDLGDAFALARRESDEVLTISCSNTFAANWLAVRLGLFQIERPRLAVRLNTADEIVDLARGQADVAIRHSAEPWPGTVSHFLMRTAAAPFASPAFLESHPPIVTAADLRDAPRLSPTDSWWALWFEQAGGIALEPAANRGLRLDSQVMEGNAAIAHQGIAILNPTLWRPQVAAGLLRRVLPQVAIEGRSYWLAYDEGRRNAPKLRAFRDWMLAEVARDAANDPDGLYRPE